MKLSDIKGERTMVVVAELIEPIANIAMDEEASELFTKKVVPEGMTPREFTLKRMAGSMPKLIKEHSDDLIRIYATINDIDPEKCKKTITIPELIKGIVDIVSDEVFLKLFT